MKAVAKPLTQEQQVLTPNLPEPQIEIINGIEYIVPSPKFIHQDLSMSLSVILALYVRAKKCGKIVCAPMDVVFAPKTDVLQPDIIYISNERKHIVGEWIEGTPDMVTEIVSASYKREALDKMEIYAKYGVPEVWIVEPKLKQIEIFVLDKNGKYNLFSSASEQGVLRSTVLPELNLEVEAVFENV